MNAAIESVYTPEAPPAVGPYSQAIRAGGFVYTAGQLGIDAETGDFAGTDVVSQTTQALRNLRAVLEAAGSDVRHVIKTTIFVTDLGLFGQVNAAYAAFLDEEGVEHPPARSTVEVAALPLQGLVEIEMIAVIP